MSLTQIDTSTFDGLIGQESVKKQLTIFLLSYKNGNRLPFLNFIAAAGNGKTHFCRTFRENLGPPNVRPPLLEVNARTIKNVGAFFDEVYPEWITNNAFLFLDEAHEIPMGLQQIFLTILNTESNPVRRITYNGIPYSFNFNDISIAFGTTDQQKIIEPLRDRLEDISFSEYSKKDLYKIFIQNVGEELKINKGVIPKIKEIFRGSPRDVVKKSENLINFCEILKAKEVDDSIWSLFCDSMGILPYGMNKGEFQVLKAIGDRGRCSLQSIKSSTGFSRSAIQKDYESFLLKCGLMDIDGQRYLTNEGRRLYRSLSQRMTTS